MKTQMPRWEQRVRAPQLMSFSLIGPAVSWAADRSDSGVLLATLSGRAEVYAFDATEHPGRLTQVTDRAQGTTGASMTRDGSAAFWFDDEAGDEVGRWQRQSIDDGSVVALLPSLTPSYTGGIAPLGDGGAVVGRLVEEGFELAVADNEGAGDVVYRSSEPAHLVDATPDGSMALIGFAPAGDWLHLGVRVIRLEDGAVVAELRDEGRNLSPVAFHPADRASVLVVHERRDRLTPMVWNTQSDAQDDVVTELDGEVTADWYPSGDALLLTVLKDARHRVYRYDRSSGAVTPIAAPDRAIAAASVRPDGSVHLLVSRSNRPVSLIKVDGDGVHDLVVLPGEEPASTVASTDVYADGPGGRVHALLSLPPTHDAPYPTVFAVHGGPTGQDLDAWNANVAALVDLGYAVVRVNYRGSTGYGAAWRDALHGRLGFIELEDITAVRDHLEQTGVVDPARVSIMGGSWGGFLTLMAAGTQPTKWRSGVAFVPLADQITSAEDAPSFMKAYDAALMGGTIEEIPEVYRAASPITYVDDVQAPLFVTAGENDPRCPVRQVDTYVDKLRARGHDVRYDRLATGHAMVDLDMRVIELRKALEFLAETLPVGP